MYRAVIERYVAADTVPRTESLLLSTIVASMLLAEDESNLHLAETFLLHSAFLHHLPLSKRSLSVDRSVANCLLAYERVFMEVASIIRSDVWGKEMIRIGSPICNLADFVDGRFLVALTDNTEVLRTLEPHIAETCAKLASIALNGTVSTCLDDMTGHRQTRVSFIFRHVDVLRYSF